MLSIPRHTPHQVMAHNGSHRQTDRLTALDLLAKILAGPDSQHGTPVQRIVQPTRNIY